MKDTHNSRAWLKGNGDGNGDGDGNAFLTTIVPLLLMGNSNISMAETLEPPMDSLFDMIFTDNDPSRKSANGSHSKSPQAAFSPALALTCKGQHGTKLLMTM